MQNEIVKFEIAIIVSFLFNVRIVMSVNEISKVRFSMQYYFLHFASNVLISVANLLRFQTFAKCERFHP